MKYIRNMFHYFEKANERSKKDINYAIFQYMKMMEWEFKYVMANENHP